MFRRMFDVRPEEYRESFAGFITLLGIMACHGMMEIARDSLFLARFPVTKLPMIYLGVAVVSVLVVKLKQGAVFQLDWRRGLGILLTAFALLTALLWPFVRGGTGWALYLLYAWPAFFATLVITAFWTHMGRLFTIAQAKRLYVMIGSGGILGAILGTAVARLIVHSLPAHALLVAASSVLLSVAWVPWLVSMRRSGRSATPKAAAASRLRRDLKVIGGRPYVLRVLMLITVTAATTTVLDYFFKSEVVAMVPAARLPEFFATFYLALNIASLLLQFVAVGWIIQRVGTVTAGALLPALILLCSGWFLAGGAALAVLLGRTCDGALRHSLNRTTQELLYLPLAAELRERFKSVADVVGQRGGQAAASLLLVLLTTLGLGHGYLAALTTALALAWIAIAVNMRPHYLNMIRHTLDLRGERQPPPLHGMTDAALGALLARLDGDAEDKVLTALDLLAEGGLTERIPPEMLDHASPRVLRKTLNILADASAPGIVDRLPGLLEHADDGVRAAAVHALIAAGAADPENLADLAEAVAARDPAPEVQVAALIALVTTGRLSLVEAEPRAREYLAAGDAAVRKSLARAIGRAPAGDYAGLLIEASRTADAAALKAVARAMQRHPDPRQIPVLLRMLRDFQLRLPARRALVALGPEALPILERIMVDREQPFEIRRHLPRTISKFPAERAHAVLLRHLGEDLDAEIVFKIVRGLGRVRADNPRQPVPESEVLAACERLVHQTYLGVRWRFQFEAPLAPDSPLATPVREMLVDYLTDQEFRSREWLLRVLGMFYAPADLKRIHAGFGRGDPADVAAGLELLVEYLPPRLRRPVMGLLETLPTADRLKFAPASLPPLARDYESLLDEMIRSQNLHLRWLAAYHAGELGLESFRPRLEELTHSRSSNLREVAARALELMDHPRAARLAS